MSLLPRLLRRAFARICIWSDETHLIDIRREMKRIDTSAGEYVVLMRLKADAEKRLAESRADYLATFAPGVRQTWETA